MAEAELLVTEDEIADLIPAWDALAVAAGRPMCAPAWMLGQWRHLSPPDAPLRVVAVRERGELLAVAPFFAEPKGVGRIDLRLLGGAMPRTGPLALPGHEWAAARPIAEALASARPRADVLALESVPLASHWPTALADHWPGPLRPTERLYYVQTSFFVSLAAGSMDAWLATKNAHFRNRMKRARRKYAEAGGTVRASTEATVKEDIETFMRLHASRWEARGNSWLVPRWAQLTAMYEEIAREHLDGGRFRLYVLELDGTPIAARILAAAGGEVVALNGGWDERYAKMGVANVGMLHAIEDGFGRGDAHFDLGPGDQEFKRRLADGNDPVAWTLLVVPRPRMALTLARVAPTLVRIRARNALLRALTPEQIARLKALRKRIR